MQKIKKTLLILQCRTLKGLPRWLSGKESTSSAGHTDSIPESGRAPGVENGNPLQYSCLGNPWTEEPGTVQSMGLQRPTRLSTHGHMQSY